MAADAGGAGAGLKDGGEEAQAGGFARAIDAEQPEDLPRLAAKIHVVHRPDFAAFLIAKELGQLAGFNHAALAGVRGGCPRRSTLASALEPRTAGRACSPSRPASAAGAQLPLVRRRLPFFRLCLFALFASVQMFFRRSAAGGRGSRNSLDLPR